MAASADSLPSSLLKFQRFSDFTVSGLVDGTLWFAKPSTFNDPFDCAYQIIESNILPYYLVKDISDLLSYEDRQRQSASEETVESKEYDGLLEPQSAEQMRTLKQSFEPERGVCCFVSTPYDDPLKSSNDDILMWGHYAESHRGLCLVFDPQKLGFPKEVELMAAVKYAEAFPAWNIEQAGEGNLEQITEYLLTKAMCWRYENEVRAVSRTGGCAIPYN